MFARSKYFGCKKFYNIGSRQRPIQTNSSANNIENGLPEIYKL